MINLGATSSGPLTDYNRIYSSKGLFIRYANGRLRHLIKRLLFAIVAGLILGYVISPEVGILATVIACLGDAIDCLFLRAVPDLMQRGYSFRRLQIFSGLTAAIQALTTGVFIWFSWYAQDLQAEPLFAVGLLISAAINGGLILPYNRLAGIVRLAIFALTPPAILLIEIWIPSEFNTYAHMNMAGLIMVYPFVIWFLLFMVASFHRNRLHQQDQFEQRKQLEVSNALLLEQQQEARKLALVAEHANDSVFLIDRNGYISWVNDSFSRITGYSFSEAVGHTPTELLGTDEADEDSVRKLLDSRKNGLPIQIEIRSRCKDGTVLWIDSNQVPVRGYDGKVEMVVAVERDVTAAHLHAQQLEKARRSAEKGERSKTDFLATMSHEIRTPMNGVIGMAQMLEETTLDADQRLYTDTILSSARTLLSLINDVLDLSKLEAYQMSLSRVDFNIRTCFQETLRLLQSQAQEKGLSLVFDASDEVPEQVHGDDHRVRQILLNLVGNAIKFTESGEVRVTLKTQTHGDALELTFSVTDTGIGIPPDKLDHVFERFSQAEAATTRRFGGTGLGLTISRRLANAMGGEITVSSELGVGSCFTVTLQLAVGQAKIAPNGNDVDAQNLVGPLRAGLRVLVAEDNKVNRLVMRKFLRNVPIELEFAHDGCEAVEKVQTLKPDLVFMDMSMPVMNGIDATVAIRSNDGVQPVIVALTANAFDSDRAACLQAGMDEFLSKPLNRSEVLAVIHRHGAGKRTQPGL